MTATMTISSSTPISTASPSRNRRSLRIPSIQSNYESYAPNSYTGGHLETSFHSRKSSQSSFQQYSPVTPRPPSSRSKRPSSSRLSIGSNISTSLTSNAGFGNLADELEEAWDPEMDDGDSVFLEDLQESDHNAILRSPTLAYSPRGYSNEATPRSPKTSRGLLELPDKPPSPSKQWASMGTRFKTESFYDGSECGNSSDGEAFDQIVPTLQRKMHSLEEITRVTSNADTLSESGGVISRTTTALRDNLGTQVTIESSISRLVTAYTSLSTHRVYQGREILVTSHPVMSSGAFSPVFDLPHETIETITEEMELLIATLPFLSSSPTTTLSLSNPLIALQSFVHSTYDFIATLHSLTDTLIEHRQHLLTATRRLKSVRELVDELRTEEDLVEMSMKLILAGDWDRRCRERHAAKAVGELLEGFKTTWNIDYVDRNWQPEWRTEQEIFVR